MAQADPVLILAAYESVLVSLAIVWGRRASLAWSYCLPLTGRVRCFESLSFPLGTVRPSASAPLVAIESGILHDRGDFAVRIERDVEVLMRLQVVVGTGPDKPEVIDKSGRGRPVGQRER